MSEESTVPDGNANANANANATHGNYFHNKRVKQREQDRELVRQLPMSERSHALRGCTIYVNGHTDPPRLQLHDLVVKHGGVFLHYLSSHGAATHIVAEHLPPKKRVEFRNCKVVKPQWVVDSVREGRALPWAGYSALGGAGQAQAQLPQGQLPLGNSPLGNKPSPWPSNSPLPQNALPSNSPLPQNALPSNSPLPQNALPSNSPLPQNPPPRDIPSVSSHPQAFLDSYFAHSRLHKLSEWKARLRLEFVRAHTQTPPLRDPGTLHVLHFDFDCFFAAVAFVQRDKGQYPNLDFARDPIAVCHGGGNSDIASCNYAARQLGVRNGMWAGGAQRRLPPGAVLTLLPYDFAAIEEASRVFYEVLRGCAEFVWVLPVSIDEAVCVLQGSPSECLELGPSEDSEDGLSERHEDERSGELHEDGLSERHEDDLPQDDLPEGSLSALATRLRLQILRRTGCTVSAGIGPSLVLARLSLRLAKPDGVYVCPEQPRDSFYAQFTARDLPGVGSSALAKLQGPDTDLSKLRHSTTLPSLQSLLGAKLGSKVWLGLHGQDDPESQRMLLDPCTVFDRKSVAVDINWGIRLATVPQLDAFLDVCAAYTVGKLQECAKRAGNVTLKLQVRAPGAPVEPPKYLGMGRCTTTSQSAGFGVPTADTGVVSTELKALFRSLAVPVAELRGVAVHLGKLSSAEQKPWRGLQCAANVVATDSPQRTPQARRLRVSPVKDRGKAAEAEEEESPQVTEFLQALPTQLQREVRRDLARPQSESGRGKLRAEMQRRSAAAASVNAHLTGSGGTLLAPVRFQGEASFKRVCRMVESWVRQTCVGGAAQGPHERDVAVFLRYVEKLCAGDRVHLALRVASLVSTILALEEARGAGSAAYAEWEHILLRRVLPVLNRNRLTLQTERRLDVEWEV